MPVIPTFDNERGTDFIGEQESLMQRMQNRRIQAEQAQHEQDQFEAFKPVIQAEAQAKVAGAQAAVANATRMAQLRTQAASDSPNFNNEFLDAMQLADYEASADALQRLQAKVGYMSLLPEYKGFVDAVNNARVTAVNSAIVNKKLDEHLAATNAAVQGREDVAKNLNETKLQLEQEKTDRAKEVQAMKNRSQELLLKQHQSLTDPAQLQDRAAEYDKLAADNPDSAAEYQAVAKQLRDRATRVTQPRQPQGDKRLAIIQALTGGAPAGETKTATQPATVKTPQGDRPIPPGTKVFEEGGKKYPIAVDAHGNRAYYKDGKWIEISAKQ